MGSMGNSVGLESMGNSVGSARGCGMKGDRGRDRARETDDRVEPL